VGTRTKNPPPILECFLSDKQRIGSHHLPFGWFLESAPAATQMRKNGTSTMIDRNADINLNVWFREGFG
jgi:hypothetical protein